MSTENSSPNLFSSDRPITSRDQDELGRRTFSEEISRAVRGWKGQVSFALYGPWGTGKSSIKNMVIDALRVTPDAATVIDFNPWQVSHREQLSQAFFDEIGIAIGKGPLASRKDQQKAASKWKRYAARLKSTGGVLNLFVKPIRWTLPVSAILIVGSTIPILRPLAIVSAILYVLVGRSRGLRRLRSN